MTKAWLVWVGALAVIVGLLVIALVLFGGEALRGVCPWCGGSAVDPGITSPRGPMGRGPFTGDVGTPDTYSSNGETIYFTGYGHSGLIRRSVGFGPGMMGGTGCATCHGADGRGSRFVMMGREYDAPDITYTALTSPHTGEHEDEPAWTDDDIRTAIREGVEPSGDTLDPIMPRWDMDDRDMADLLGYLKELSAQ